MTSRGLPELVARLGGELRGSGPAGDIQGVLPPDEAGPEHVTLYIDPRLRTAVARTRAAAVLTAAPRASHVTQAGRTAWVHPDPGAALVELVDILHPTKPETALLLDSDRCSWVS